jgi:hypothetical protein
MGDNNNIPTNENPHVHFSVIGGGSTTPYFPSNQMMRDIQVMTSPLISGSFSVSTGPTSIMDSTHPTYYFTNAFSFRMSSIGEISIPIPSQPFIQGSSSGARSS